jgi:hypothetical protein
VVHHLVQRTAPVLGDSGAEQGCVLGFLHRLEDERGVGGRILRLECVKLLEIAGVGYHGGE